MLLKDTFDYLKSLYQNNSCNRVMRIIESLHYHSTRKDRTAARLCKVNEF